MTDAARHHTLAPLSFDGLTSMSIERGQLHGAAAASLARGLLQPLRRYLAVLIEGRRVLQCAHVLGLGSRHQVSHR